MWNPKILALGLLAGFTFGTLLEGQQSSRRATTVPDLFNQEAAASDSVGIHRYSEDLIGLIVPRETGKVDIGPLANRLAHAEQMAREGQGKLVPEAAVAKAFNDLMQGIGAPPSMRASEAPIHRFREHAAAIKAFPALFSANHNGTNCNPGEAVFLLYLLISDNGALSERYLGSAQIPTSKGFQPNADKGSVAGGVVAFGSSASRSLSAYSLQHSRSATNSLFNGLIATLGY